MWRIPLSDLNYDHREAEAVRQVLDAGWLTMGPRTRDFEDKFAAYHHADAAVAVANCTCALDLVYRFVLQQAGPERRAIIVPDITFVATANAVIAAGGIPILCDIESPERPYLSYTATEELMASRNDIAGVVIVHYAGHDAGAEDMAEMCARYKVSLIEDCAHAPGATTASGRFLGTVGLAGCFSFFSNKNLSTGEGGMVLPNKRLGANTLAYSWVEWLRNARNHGTTGGGTWQRHVTGTTGYNIMFPGYNYRCTEITAALGIVQLQKLAEGNTRRQQLTKLYAKLLQDSEGIHVVLPTGEIETSACHILPVLLNDPDTRTRVGEALAHSQIQMSHHYPALHTFHWYSENNVSTSTSLANATAYAARELTLPLHPKLTVDHVHEIVDVIKDALR